MDLPTYKCHLERVYKKVPARLLKLAETLTRKTFIRPEDWEKDIDHIEFLRSDIAHKISMLQVETYLHNRLTILDTKFAGLLTLDSIFLAIFAFSVRNRSLEHYSKCETTIRYIFPLICSCFVVSNFLALWFAGERYYAKFYLMQKQHGTDVDAEFDICVKEYSRLTYKRLTYLHFALFWTVVATISVSIILIITWYPTLGVHSHLFSMVGACQRWF